MPSIAPLDALLLSQVMQVTLGVVLLVAFAGLRRVFHTDAVAALAKGWACFLLLMILTVGYVLVFRLRLPWGWLAAAAAVQDLVAVCLWWRWRPIAKLLSGRTDPRNRQRDLTLQILVPVLAIAWDILDAAGTWRLPASVLDHVFAVAFAWLAWSAWREARVAERNAAMIRWLALGFLLYTVRTELTIALLPREGFPAAHFTQLAVVAGLQMAHVAGFGAICLVLSLGLEQSAILAQSERLRDAEARLGRARHLASLGDLAARVAHDFGNVLQGIASTLELAKEDLPEPAAARLGPVSRFTEHGSRLVSQLLGFARAGASPEGRCTVGAFLDQDGPALVRLAGEGRTLEVVAACRDAVVALDPTTLARVLMNLVANARDASPPGGTIRLEFARVPGGAGERLRIRVADAGAGIPAEFREKIFEPFFSTKGSAGTGLGLATVAAIVSHAGGDITIDSQVGRGTCVDVRLPLAPPALRAELGPQS